MKIYVDQQRCSGHGLCAMTSDIFVLDDEGYNRMVGVDVPADREQDARRGALACPERAIDLRD